MVDGKHLWRFFASNYQKDKVSLYPVKHSDKDRLSKQFSFTRGGAAKLLVLLDLLGLLDFPCLKTHQTLHTNPVLRNQLALYAHSPVGGTTANISNSKLLKFITNQPYRLQLCNLGQNVASVEQKLSLD